MRRNRLETLWHMLNHEIIKELRLIKKIVFRPKRTSEDLNCRISKSDETFPDSQYIHSFQSKEVTEAKKYMYICY